MANSYVGGKVEYILEADDSKLRAGLASAKSQIDQFGAAAKKGSADTSDSFDRLGSTIKRAVVAFALEETARKFVSFGIASATSLQTTSTSMQLLTGSTQVANRTLGELYKFVLGTPFAFPDVAAAANTLLQFGINADQVVPITEALGNVVAVTGANYQHLAEIYGQVNAEGKIQMLQVQELTQNGVPILGALSKVTGQSLAQLSASMQAGGVSAKAFNGAIQSIAPPDALNALANTLPTRLSALQGALRSVAFAFLGIRIDPIKGFVVEAGGLFDQLSNAVAALARELRSPAIQGAFQQIGSAVGAIASVAIPAFLTAVQLIGNNLSAIIPIVGAFIGSLIALSVIQAGVGLVGLGITIAALGPEMLVVAGIAVVLAAALGFSLGGVIDRVGGTLRNLSKSAENAADSMLKGTDTVKKASDATGQLVHLTDQQRQQLQDIAANIVKANRDFNQSLADIVKSSESKIADLKKQVADEAASFTKAQQQKAADFAQSQADQLATHQDTVAGIQKELDNETSKARFADQTRLSDLRDRLAKENADYQHSTSEKLATYQQDTQNAKEEHDKKTADLQAQLNDETNFLQKHSLVLSGIRAADAKDQIDKLVQSHNDQLAQLELQRQRVVAKASQTGADTFTAQANATQAGINTGVFKNLGTQIGDQLGSKLKDSVVGWVNSIPGEIVKIFSKWASDKGTGALISLLLPGIGSALTNVGKALHIPGFASGIEDFVGGLAIVHKDEALVNLAPHTSVVPAQQTREILGQAGGSTYNITMINHNNNAGDLEDAWQRMLWRTRNA